MKYLLILIVPLFLTNCKTVKDEKIEQGVVGTVLWFEGNLMPSPGVPAPEGKPIERTVLICELTNTSQVKGDAPIYENIPDQIIKEIKSDKSGVFKTELPVGEYSVFVKEDSGYFANSFDAKNNICVLKIEKDKITEMKIDVNYKASF
ncbi:MAG: carboxypeptidase regulatory-like domain-containing protein [Bacteroidota bacterium]